MCSCHATATDPSSITSKEHSLNAPTPDLAALFAAHGLAGVAEEPLAHAGYSGSQLYRLRRHDGASFVIKRMSLERDWIMRATNDVHCREGQFVGATSSLPRTVRVPSIGSARDGDTHALLMLDITPQLIDPELVTISEHQLDAILAAAAALHASAPPAVEVAWCGLRERLTLLTPQTMRIASAYRAPVARDVTAGWELFARHAPPDVASLVDGLFSEPSPLLAALQELPSVLLHGDLKLDNIGLDDDGTMWLIDWAMTLTAPAAVDLGWFLAINSRRLPASLADVMERYASAARVPTTVRERHDALTALCGLLLRGWRKALDAESGEPEELRWWCECARNAARFL